MMFLDCHSAVLNAHLIVLALLSTGHYISHSKPFIFISDVLAPLRWTGGKSSTLKPCSVKNTTVAFSCVCRTTPFGVIVTCFIRYTIADFAV